MVILLPLDRVLIYAYPFIAFFAALTVIKFYDKNKSKNFLITLLLILTCIPLIAGVVNASQPAFLFKDSQIDSFYWFSNNLSSVNNYDHVGVWIKNYTNDSRPIATEFDTRVLVTYFVESTKNSYYPYGTPDNFKGYFVFNPGIIYQYNNNFNKTEYVNTNNVFYDDGTIIVGGVGNI